MKSAAAVQTVNYQHKTLYEALNQHLHHVYNSISSNGVIFSLSDLNIPLYVSYLRFNRTLIF